MDQVRELRRMPPGEFCPDCGSQKWYLLDGMRYCSRDHQIEGFIQFDVGDEEDAGVMGAVMKREKEAKEVVIRQLTGNAGKTLYLEALQLVLRKQVLWLINEQGHKPELETVVRDLWDLRIRGFDSTTDEDADNADEVELQTFSSQPAEEEKKTVPKSRSRAQSWNPERGTEWPMPRVVDTLALCYLGCVLLRIPTQLGQLALWAQGSNIPFKRVFYELPQEMQGRMPSAYIKALKMSIRQSLGEGGLHGAVIDLVISYRLNYEMPFPDINHVPMLVEYARVLALPLEVIVVTRELAATLNCRYRFPDGSLRILPLDHPEIRLAAVLVVATKLCFPFNGKPSSMNDHDSDSFPLFDWDKWHKIMSEPREETYKPKKQFNFDNAPAGRVATMSDEELTEYFAHISSFIDQTNDNPITQFFPTETPLAPAVPTSEISGELIDDRNKSILRQALQQFELPASTQAEESASVKPKIMYGTDRDVKNLEGSALAFYKAASAAAGTSLDTLVRAVYTLENAVFMWQKREEELNMEPYVDPLARYNEDMARWREETGWTPDK